MNLLTILEIAEKVGGQPILQSSVHNESPTYAKLALQESGNAVTREN